MRYIQATYLRLLPLLPIQQTLPPRDRPLVQIPRTEEQLRQLLVPPRAHEVAEVAVADARGGGWRRGHERWVIDEADAEGVEAGRWYEDLLMTHVNRRDGTHSRLCSLVLHARVSQSGRVQ